MLWTITATPLTCENAAKHDEHNLSTSPVNRLTPNSVHTDEDEVKMPDPKPKGAKPAIGALFDETKHDLAYTPPGPYRSFDSITTGDILSPRVSTGGVIYCQACDRAISDNATATSLWCPIHKNQRATRASTHSRERKRISDHLENAEVTLSYSEAMELLKALSGLRSAIGRASARFKAAERGTWQHNLLLASKSVEVASTALRRASAAERQSANREGP